MNPVQIPQDPYQIRESIEAGAQNYFIAQGYDCISRFNSPVAQQQARPRFEIVAQVGTATGRRRLTAGGTVIDDGWRITVQFKAVTNDTSDGINAQHALFVSTMHQYAAAMYAAAANDTVNFPNHCITEPLREAGRSGSLDTENGVETTTIQFTSGVIFRPSIVL